MNMEQRIKKETSLQASQVQAREATFRLTRGLHDCEQAQSFEQVFAFAGIR